MHKISEEELVEKLKFIAKGEPKGKPTFEISITKAMISREIKDSDVYLNYLANYPNARSSAPTLRRGQVDDNLLEDPVQALNLAMLINLEEHQQREKERILKIKHDALVLEKEVNKEVYEAYDAQLKLKLKAQQHVSPNAQLLLNLKKGAKESKQERIME
ncbi:hypothetical protein Tco_0273242 [Tanacetum coccineum]